MNTVPKSTIINNIAETLRITKTLAKDVLDATLVAIQTNTEAGARVQLTGFGTFEEKSYEARLGRNIRTGEAIEIPARSRLTFKAAKAKA